MMVTDWGDCDFSVAATLDDFVAVVFELAGIDSVRALVRSVLRTR